MVDKRYTIGCITQLTENGVSQTVDIHEDVMTRVADVQAAQFEDGIRKTLIKLGWTPPHESKSADDSGPPDWAVVRAFWEISMCPDCTAERTVSEWREMIETRAREIAEEGA